jgi:VIT1/CCC1 family predicted Fe2+/Mn2+ transporter
MRHRESHRTQRIGWLRAAVLGADDGIVSTASLVIGVAAGGVGRHGILLSGTAGLVAGALSMAAGEYVSVSSQADTERADLARERAELTTDPVAEERELAAIYVKRGLDQDLAHSVARQLMAHDALGAHARDELGFSDNTTARPLQAALSSAASFTAGAALPMVAAIFSSPALVIPIVCVISLLCLATMGAIAARTGGAPVWTGAARVAFWGALAMAITAGAGALFGTAAT